MKISPARTAAFDVLKRIETESAFSSILLPQAEERLSEADSSLCHELTLGTLRRRIYLDRLIDTLSNGKKIDVEVRIALRLGLYQLYFLDKIPDYSSVNESVNLVRRAKKMSAQSFVNAVLRRAIREQPVLTYTDTLDELSLETSHPKWLIQKWIADLGIDEARKVAACNNEVPKLAFRVLRCLDQAETSIVSSAVPSRYVEGCFLAGPAMRGVTDLAAVGAVYIQDEGSQMVASAVDLPKGGHFLDVCAAPGGKTGMIAKKYKNAALIAAGDLYRPRIEHLRSNCRRQAGSGVSVLQYDAVKGLPFADKSFETVLIDAPCSGTGTLRHNPEIRYSLRPCDIADLAEKQLAILKNASKLVKPGGTLVYSTCSLEKEENEDVCAGFRAGNANFVLEPPNVAAEYHTDGGYARTWPHRHGMDGFFIAVFRRTSAPV